MSQKVGELLYAPKIVSQDTERQQIAWKAPLYRTCKVSVVPKNVQTEGAANIHNVLLRDEAFLEKELLSEEDNTALNCLNMQQRDLDGVYHDLGAAKRHAWKQRRIEESTVCWRA